MKSVKGSYFASKSSGLKSDLKRHSLEEKDLIDKIEEASKEGNERGVRVYKHFLNILLESKSKLTSQIGKVKGN